MAWTFFWAIPKVDDGAKVGCAVTYEGGKEYYRWGPNHIEFERWNRSDFLKERTGKESSELYGKEIVVKSWATRGKIRFAKEIKFEFCDENGKVIKLMNGVKVGK